PRSALTASLQPEEAKSQRGIDRSLGFLLVHAEHRNRAATFVEEPARIDRRKALLQVHGSGEPGSVQLPVRALAAEHSLQHSRVAASCCLLRPRRPPVTIGTNFQLARPCLGEAADGQAKQTIPELDIDDLANQIALFRPQM